MKSVIVPLQITKFVMLYKLILSVSVSFSINKVWAQLLLLLLLGPLFDQIQYLCHQEHTCFLPKVAKLNMFH